MPDVLGHRGVWGVIVPSTNTVVEADFWAMRPRGITFHAGLMYIERPQLGNNAEFEQLLEQIMATLKVAIRDCLTAKPDYMVMGMSAGTFWGGAEGNERFTRDVAQMSGGLRVTTGATACSEALAAYGAKRIAFITPYQPVADEQVGRYFADCGFEVKRWHGLKCQTATEIAEVPEQHLIEVLKGLDGDDLDAIVQVGTNLSMVGLAAAAEQWLGKPVIAINAATLWHAMRANGIGDRLDGFGSLLSEH